MHTAKRRYRTRNSSDGIISATLAIIREWQLSLSLSVASGCILHPTRAARAGTPARSRFCNVRLAGG